MLRKKKQEPDRFVTTLFFHTPHDPPYLFPNYVLYQRRLLTHAAMAMARCLLSQTPHLPPSARALTAAHPPAPSQPASLQRYNGHPPTGARFRLPAAPPVGAELPFHQPDLMAAPPSGAEPTRHRAQGSGCRSPRLRRRATLPLVASGPYSAVSAAAAFGIPPRAWTHPLPWICSSPPPARQWRA
jgi:hypothetical protein